VAVVCSVKDAGDRIALTFDDGPCPQYTVPILETLALHHARATFFVLGGALTRSGREVVKQTQAAGHEIGNHTQNHVNLGDPSQPLESEIETTHRELTQLLGSSPRLIRPPAGRGIARVEAYASKLEYMATVLWNISPRDYETPPADTIAERVLRGENPPHDEIARHCAYAPHSPLPGGIVLLHDGAPRYESSKSRHPTVRAVRKIVPQLQDRGLQLVTVSELLDAGS
jgi:chitin deacetylase